MRLIGTIEARMGSSRLPGKTLSKVHGDAPLLECVVRRFRECKSLELVVVATTVERQDDPIAEWCESQGVEVFRGSEDDVLDRVVKAAEHYGAEAIIQMGADSAYLDWELIDQLAERYRAGDLDYVCNDLTLTYPLGIYGHVVSVQKLSALNGRADLSDKERSDVVRHIFEHPEAYRICNVEAPSEFRHPELRLTIDYPEDMEQARSVYAHFGGYRFTTYEILGLYRQRPELFEKTRNLVQQSAPFLAARK